VNYHTTITRWRHRHLSRWRQWRGCESHRGEEGGRGGGGGEEE
ncbi:unnamed protein product, partial [Musa acuminata var. zebrina]